MGHYVVSKQFSTKHLKNSGEAWQTTQSTDPSEHCHHGHPDTCPVIGRSEDTVTFWCSCRRGVTRFYSRGSIRQPQIKIRNSWPEILKASRSRKLREDLFSDGGELKKEDNLIQ